jgi:hypothetical protein
MSSENPQVAPAPRNGAGLFDVDPEQDEISQDPAEIIVGDVESLPEDMEL